MSQTKELTRTLKQELIGLTGNKVYYRDLESLFKKLSEMELTSREKSALRHLNIDLRSAKFQKNKKNSSPFF